MKDPHLTVEFAEGLGLVVLCHCEHGPIALCELAENDTWVDSDHEPVGATRKCPGCGVVHKLPVDRKPS